MRNSSLKVNTQNNDQKDNNLDNITQTIKNWGTG
jgi:hypothetical protein